MTAGYVGQNPYVLETFFEPTRGNWIYKPDYFILEIQTLLKFQMKDHPNLL